MSAHLPPGTEVFHHAGHEVRVRMEIPNAEQLAAMIDPPPPDPPGRETVRFFNMAYLAHTLTVPPGSESEPCVVFGVWCPAGFVVEGLDYSINFSIRSTSNRTHDIVITGLNVSSRDLPGGVQREKLAHIPTGKLLAAALNAASTTFIYYPAHYNGPRLTLGPDGQIIEAPPEYATIHTEDDGAAFPVPRGAGLTVPSDFTLAVAGVPPLIGALRLAEVARIVRETPPGLSTEKLVATRFACSTRHARRLIEQSRQEGHEPTNDRTRKGTK